MWVDKDCEIYSISVKLWLEKNDIKIYSAHNEENPVFTERFIRNTYHITTKMKSVEVKSNTHINSSKEINDEDLNLNW